VTLHGKTYNFEPWTLAYASTDLTAKPRTPVHAMPSKALLSIYTSTPPRGRTYSSRHWTVIRSQGYIVRSSVPLLCILLYKY